MFPSEENSTAMVEFRPCEPFSYNDPTKLKAYLDAVGRAQRPWFPRGVAGTGAYFPLLALRPDDIDRMGCYLPDAHDPPSTILARISSVLARVMYSPTYVLLRGGMRKMSVVALDAKGTAGVFAPSSAPVEVVQYGPPSRQALVVCASALVASDAEVLEFILAHELMHWIRGDVFLMGRCSRDKMVGELPFDGKLLNMALDCIVNASLARLDLRVPDVALMHVDISWDTSVEEAYRILWNLVPKDEKSSDAGADSSDHEVDPFQFGHELVPNPDNEPATARQEHLAVKDIEQSLQEARQAGCRHGEFMDRISAMNARPVDLPGNFMAVIDEMTTGCEQESEEPGPDNLAEWWAASRQGTELAPVDPAMVGVRILPVAVILDTSASMTKLEMARLFDVLVTAYQRGLTVLLLDVDREVAAVRLMEPGVLPSSLDVKGRGGTDLCRGFDLIRRTVEGDQEAVRDWPALAALEKGVSAVVVVTDTQTPWPDRWDLSEVIVLATAQPFGVPTWARVIQ